MSKMSEQQRLAEAQTEWLTQAKDAESNLKGFGTAAIVFGWLSLVGGLLGGMLTIEDDGILIIFCGMVSFVVLNLTGYAAKALSNTAACVRAIWQRGNSDA